VATVPSCDATSRQPESIATETPAARLSPARVVAGLAVVAALWWAQVVLIPLVVGVLGSYALEPLVMLLERRRVPRAVAVPLLLMVLSGAIGGGLYELRGEAVSFVNRIPIAAHTIAQAIERTRVGTPGTMSKVQEAARELELATNKATTKRASDGVPAVRIQEPTFKWSDWVWQGSNHAMALAGQLFAVLCLIYYLLVSGDLYKRKLVRIMPTLSEKKVTVEILGEIDRQIERFLVARVAISAVVGLAIWMAFRLLGMDAADVWGVLSAFLFAVPIVGPTVVVIAAGIAAFLQFGSAGMAAAVVAVCVAIGALEGNALTPWLMSRVGQMNAVAVFVSLMFWGWIWGVWGLLLAVPITAAAKAICERVPDLAPFAELLKE